MKFRSFTKPYSKHFRLFPFAMLIVGLALLTAPIPVAYAATLTVNTTADELNTDGDCSLREAIRAANLDLRVDACAAGSGTDTIKLPAGIYALSLSGQDEDATATGDLDITRNLKVIGAGETNTIIDGNGLDRVFDNFSDATTTISKVTIQNGNIGFACGAGLHNRGKLTVQYSTIRNNSSSCGGGIFNEEPGTLSLIQSTVKDNTGSITGGGIYNKAGGGFGAGKLTLTESTVSGNNGGLGGGGIADLGSTTLILSTISGNHALDGGGIYSSNSGQLVLTNVTISGNTANRSGGGILGAPILNNVTISYNIADSDNDGVGDGGGIYSGSPTNIKNTILAHNIDYGGEAPDCSGILNSQAYNLIWNTTGCMLNGSSTGNLLGVDPLLSYLQNNGGSTLTHSLLVGSAAIDTGNPAKPGSGNACAKTDQRKVARPKDGDGDGRRRCDIGAVERSSASTAFDINDVVSAAEEQDEVLDEEPETIELVFLPLIVR